MAARWITTKKGRVLACGCGQPLTGAMAYVKVEAGRYDGSLMLCHATCIRPDNDDTTTTKE